MKVTQLVTVEQEIEVSISVDDIRAAIHDDADSLSAAFRLLNTCAEAMKAIPDELVVTMTPSQRECVANFLKTQINRYS